ncbi:unnamed protein product [Lupinus luteus]|uniref:Uncharacterized protein n=1 Tax=Lupinus luteus TaxID=3873 RepID=A0AAV1W2Y1_LUPLU
MTLMIELKPDFALILSTRRHYSFYEYVDTMEREVHRGPTSVEGVEATLLEEGSEVSADLEFLN